LNLEENRLQGVVVQVPLDGVLDGIGALEEFSTFLLLFSARVGIQVFIKEFPHVVGKAQDFQISGILESALEFLSHVSVVFGFPHDLADEPLLAVQVIVVELFVQVLEHGDPLDDVEAVVVISVIGRPILSLLVVRLVICWVSIVVVPVVRVVAEKATDIDQVADDSEENQGSQKGEGGGGAGGVKVQESCLILGYHFFSKS